MTSRSHIENAIRSLYAARVKGDLEGTLKDLAEEAVFRINGREFMSAPFTGKAAIRPVVQELIKHWRFEDWKECSLLVDGEKALLHWTARVTYTPTNKSENVETFDVVTFRDDKTFDYLQSTDTALVSSLAAA
jgi:ketosteroid isomerase-like protein